MKRRLSFWVAFAARALRLLAPFAAYASPSLGMGNICSAAGKASAAAESPGGAPLNAHLVSHCADCPCGATAAALPTAFALPLPIAVHAPPAGRDGPTARPAKATLFPPPRGPPAIRSFV